MTAAPEADATITSHGRGRAGPDWPGQGWAGAVAWLRSSACPGWSKPALSHGWGLVAQLGCQWGLGPPRVAAEFQEQVFRAAGRASCRPKLCPRLAQRASQQVALIKAMPLPGQARGQRTTRTSGQRRTLRWETRPSSISKNITRHPLRSQLLSLLYRFYNANSISPLLSSSVAPHCVYNKNENVNRLC